MVTHVNSWFRPGLLLRAADVPKVRLPNNTFRFARLIFHQVMPSGGVQRSKYYLHCNEVPRVDNQRALVALRSTLQ
jgi:hypothetical protein